MKILVTGGCGFIGHHVVEHILKTTDWSVAILDKLTYASNGFDRLRDIDAFDDRRVRLFTSDIAEPISPGLAQEIGDIDYLVHMAAETHVDNSIVDPIPFVLSNVLGTAFILQYAQSLSALQKFLYFGTDEVFGPAPAGVAYKEWDRYRSSNPYAATKAGGEELVLAWHNTHRVPAFCTHTMNVFGERQHPEKFIPKVIRAVLRNEAVAIHASADKTKAGSRFWIHARNVADAVVFLLQEGVPGDKYNIVGEREIDNLALAQLIADILGRDLRYEMVDFHSSRPGHDLRYALDGEKLSLMEWSPPVSIEKSLEKTIRWYVNHPQWLNL